MKTYLGLEYSLKIKEIILQTINNAKENILDQYYVVCDDPNFLEEAFFKHTDFLFNIQIMRYQDLLTKLIYHYQLQNQQKISLLEKILITKQQIERENNLFNTPNKMILIEELIKIFDLFYQEDLDLTNLNNFSGLSKQKITTIISLYTHLIKSIPASQCYGYEECLFPQIDDSLKNIHFIFISEQIFNRRSYQFIKQLDRYCEITILLNYQDDHRELNKIYEPFLDETYFYKNNNDYLNHLNKYLFALENHQYSKNSPLKTISQTTPQAEIDSVVLEIYRNIVDHGLHYRDFAIYYPNEAYLKRLTAILDQFKIPHNIKKQLKFNEFDACILWLQYCLSQELDDLMIFLDTKILSRFNDYNYIDSIKKKYYETGFLTIDFINDYDFSSPQNLRDFSVQMIALINQEFITNQNTLTLINFFKKISSDDIFTLKEYYELVKQLRPSLTEDKTIISDHLYLFNHQQCYSGILDCKQTYLVGVNETIVPQQFKDTGILLDQDRQDLHLHDLNYQNAQCQNQLLRILNSNSKCLVLSFSNATIAGEPLLTSSLYLQLKKMFKCQSIDISKDYTHRALKNNLYLKNGRDENATTLNQMLNKYLQSANQPNDLKIPVFAHQVSASKLETYNSCPYKYFNQYGLKLYPFKEPLFQANEIGTIIHYVLEQSKNMFASNQVANTTSLGDLDKFINKQVDTYLEEHNLNNRLNYRTNHFIIKMIKQDLINTIIVLINQMKVSDFKVLGSEVQINRKYPQFSFTGIVDRVDIYDKYLKIIDYKSSNKDLDISLAIQGFNIQMLLYLDTLTKQKQLSKGALLYFNTKKRILASSLKITEPEDANNFFKQYRMNGYVNENVVTEIDNAIEKDSAIIKAKYVKKDDSYKGNILTDFSFERLLDYVNKHIQDLYQEIINGKIKIHPKGSDDATLHTKVNPCTYCKYRCLCNFDVFYNDYVFVDNNNLESLIKEDIKDAN